MLSLAPYLVLLAIVFAVFGNSLKGYFLCDDLLHLGYLWRAFNGEPGLLLAPFYSPWLKDTSLYAFYRPLTELSFALDYLIYGARAWGYHLTCVLLHVLNVWLFFIFVKTLTAVPSFYIAGQKQRSALAFFSAAIWAVYPTHSEAVSWIAARADLTATTFYFIVLILFAHNLAAKKPLPAAAIALPMVLALLSKELAISIAPAIFLLTIFDLHAKRISWTKCLLPGLKATLPYWLIAVIYLIVRALALGDFVGGYVGSIGMSLNQSLVDRWLYTESFFKVFHPFNDQLIGQGSPLRLALRAIWGFCGVMTIVSARSAGALAPKYRLMAFTLAWLVLTLAPNIQVWNFTDTLANGRIAYLPTAPIVLLIVLSVYPLGAQSDKRGLASKIFGLATLAALTVLFGLVTNINNRAWLQASDMVRVVRGQLQDLIKNKSPGTRIALLNLPSHVKGAYAFTSFSMVDSLLKPPLSTGDLASAAVVLDNQPCAYPRVNFKDVKAAAASRDFALYYYDSKSAKLLQATAENFSSPADKLKPLSNRPMVPDCVMDMQAYEVGGTTFRFRIEPPVTPGDFEYLRVKLTLSPAAKVSKTDKLCYVWNNGPANEDGDSQAFNVQLATTPVPGHPSTYLLRLGENKLWLLSKNVTSMQFFVPGLSDSESRMDIQFCDSRQTAEIAPSLKAQTETTNNRLISLQHLWSKDRLHLTFDATHISGARGVKIEILPPYNYFDHFSRKMYEPAFCPKQLKVLSADKLSGDIVLSTADFPRAAIYQARAGAVDARGEVLGDFSEPVTVTVH